jgi:transketolase
MEELGVVMSRFSSKKKQPVEAAATSPRRFAKKAVHTGGVPAAAYLVANLEGTATELDPIRKGFGRGLKVAAEANKDIVALCADLTDSTQMSLFKESFPERFVEVGVAEQNLVTVSSGMAALGKIPYCSSYAAFMPGRCWEQIRTTICLNDQPVKLIGSHAGVSVGPDGATHQMLEDIALMRSLPNMVVIVPCDSKEAEKATVAMSEDSRPNYLRLAREATPVFTTDKTPFEIGKAQVFREGTDVTIVATGVMTYQAMVAAEKLAKDGISAEVVHCATIKPLDEAAIIKSAKKTGRVVTAEEGQIAGGLGGAVAELLGEKLPTPMKRIGAKDRFGESGTPEELQRAFGLTHTHIAIAAHQLM